VRSDLLHVVNEYNVSDISVHQQRAEVQRKGAVTKTRDLELEGIQ